MPTTRALSMRRSAYASVGADNQCSGINRKLLSSEHKKPSEVTRLPSFSRTSSMPSLSMDSVSVFSSLKSELSNGTVSSYDTISQEASEMSGKRSSVRNVRTSLSSGSTTSRNSPCSSRRNDGSDDSDDEEERASRARPARLSGCSRLSEARPTRDDSNKENIPPLRPLLNQRNLQREMGAQQEETHARQTRSHAAAPMSDRSDAASVSSTTSSRHFRRTVSLPVVTRKRSRTSYDAGREHPSPTSRPRIDARIVPGLVATPSTTTEERDSYFSSSQAASIFDTTSTIGGSPLSRCTTPEATEVGDECGDNTYETQALEKQLCEVTTSDILHEEGTASASMVPTSEYANVFVHARALLRYGVTSDVHIVGRSRERAALQRFLQSRFGLFAHLEHSAMPSGDERCPTLDGATDSGSLYVCGLPGTGKTALIRSVLADMGEATGKGGDKRPRVAFIDCMTIQHPRELFKRILQALHEDARLASIPAGELGDAEAERHVTALVKDSSLRMLIVLDEIDHLLRSRVHQNILYRLFSLPQSTHACALIGIANSLDLTERFVPLLASKGASPAVLNFRPFEAEEIKNVIGARLALLYARYDDSIANRHDDEMVATTADDEPEPVPLFMPTAFELVARKIAAATGDLRKALDASRLAVEAVEEETISKARAASTADSSVVDLRQLTPRSAPKITPSHILKVLSAVLGSPQLTKIRSLGLQHKLTLLALLIAQKRASLGLCVLGNGNNSGGGGLNGVRTVGVCSSNASGTLICDVESTYTAMLKNDDFAALESSELIDVMEGLEVEGMVQIVSVGGGGASPTNARGRTNGGSIGGGVSPSAKRAAKRQLLASLRRMQLIVSTDEILRGITTVAPTAPSGGVSGTTSIAVDALRRIWQREEHNADRAKGWEALAKDTQRVRDEELGGGRGALGI